VSLETGRGLCRGRWRGVPGWRTTRFCRRRRQLRRLLDHRGNLSITRISIDTGNLHRHRYRRGIRGCIYLGHQSDHRHVLGIRVEQSLVPAPRFARVPGLKRHVAERSERDEIFRIERERAPEDLTRFVELTGLVERLTVYDLPAHVPGHLREVGATYLYGALRLTPFPVFVREGREIPSGVLVKFIL